MPHGSRRHPTDSSLQATQSLSGSPRRPEGRLRYAAGTSTFHGHSHRSRRSSPGGGCSGLSSLGGKEITQTVLGLHTVDPLGMDHGKSFRVILIRHHESADEQMFILHNRLRHIRPTAAGRADSNGTRLVLERKDLAIVDRGAATVTRTTMNR